MSTQNLKPKRVELIEQNLKNYNKRGRQEKTQGTDVTFLNFNSEKFGGPGSPGLF